MAEWNRNNEKENTLAFYRARANYASVPNNFGRPPGKAASEYTPQMYFMSQIAKPVNPYLFPPTPHQAMLDREAAGRKQALADQRAIEAEAKKYREKEAAAKAAAEAEASGKAEGGGRKRRYRRSRTSRRTRSRTSRRGRTSRRSRR